MQKPLVTTLYSISKPSSNFFASSFTSSVLKYKSMQLPLQPAPLPSSLSFLTFNVWFDKLERETRCLSILDYIVKLKPSVACLQEVTATFLSIVHDVITNPQNEHQTRISKQLQDLYFVTGDLANPNSVIPSYGVFMFIQKSLPVFKLENLVLPTMMDRTCLVSVLRFSNDFVVGVATVHLESLNSANIRRAQLEEIMSYLKGFSHAFLMGDFNFDGKRNFIQDEQPLENNVLQEVCGDYKDTWVELKGNDDPGFTFDTKSNPMLQGHRLEQMRYDRLIYKSIPLEKQKIFKAESIQIIGTEPISKEMSFVLPSDHYGLFATFKLV